jgi:hypothetical protein
VDSLCILQDSVQDWKVESAKMGECFKNAMLRQLHLLRPMHKAESFVPGGE